MLSNTRGRVSNDDATFIYSNSGLCSSTVQPFYLATLKVGDLMCKFILAPFILANSSHTILRQHNMPIKVGILLIFAPFNFAVLFGSRNSQNKGHAKI